MGVLRGNFEIFLGEDSIKSLAFRMKSKGYKSGLFLVDSNVSTHVRVLEIVEFLDSEGFTLTTHSIKLLGEPTYDDLDRESKSLSADNLDFVIAIGGGSLLDLAKGISVLVTNGGEGISYRGIHKVPRPGLPLVVFPTTAGTGTEMTWTASFIDSNSEVKMGINGDNIFPRFAVLDPKLLVGAPKLVLMSSALDTLVHAIEAVTSTMASPFTISLGAVAVERVLDNLGAALQPSPSLKSLELLQIAAAEAGLAMLNSSGGPASGISYPLGVHFKVPHGFAGGLLIPPVIHENIRLGYRGYTVFEQKKDGGRNFLARIKDLFSEIETPVDFKFWGFKSHSDVESIVEFTLKERTENLKLNPIPFNEHNVRSVLQGFI